MNTVQIAKAATKFIVGAGTSKIVHTIIKNNVDPQNTYDTVTVFAGSLVIGSMAANATQEYTDAKIDKFVAWCRELKSTKETTE